MFFITVGLIKIALAKAFGNSLFHDFFHPTGIQLPSSIGLHAEVSTVHYSVVSFSESELGSVGVSIIP